MKSGEDTKNLPKTKSGISFFFFFLAAKYVLLSQFLLAIIRGDSIAIRADTPARCDY